MKNAKNYPVLIISKDEFEKFQKQYMLEVIRDPTYRYGQAFMNYFFNSNKILLNHDDLELWNTSLWNTSSREKAEFLINKYIVIE